MRTRENTVLIMLDTNDYGEEGVAGSGCRVRDGTLEWVRSVLDQCRGEAALAFGHHPILPYAEGDENGARLVRILEEAGVPMYLCGHRHENYLVREEAFCQAVIGLPWSYPARIGALTVESDGSGRFESRFLFDPEGGTMRAWRTEAWNMGLAMGEGSLRGTAWEGDENARDWFAEAFMAVLDGTLWQQRARFLADPGYRKWQEAEVKSVVKPWILGLVAQPAQDDTVYAWSR